MEETGFFKADSNNLPNIDTFMLMEFINGHECYNAEEIRGLKPELSMRDSYTDNAIGYVQVKRMGTTCTILGQICPEHRIRASNYKVHILICEEQEKVVEVKCLDCAASEGGCKHALAFIMWAHRKSTQPAPTEVECYWKKPKLSGAANVSVTVEDFGVVPKPNVSAEESNTFFGETITIGKKLKCSSQLLKYFSDAEGPNRLSMHILMHSFINSGHENNYSEFLKFSENAINDTLCKNAAKATIQQSDNKLWFELRYGRVTASKMYSASTCKTHDGVFVNSVIGASKVFQSKAMKRGLTLEDKVRSAIENELNLKIENCGLLLNNKYPEFGASPDGVSNNAVFEIKCPASSKTIKNYVLEDGSISLKCKAQLHLQMFMLNFKLGYLCVADPAFENNNKIKIIKVNYDNNYFVDVLGSAREFWKKIIFPRLVKSVE